MSLQDTVRGSFGTISTLLPESILTIVSNGETASGIGNKATYGESLDGMGERGITRGGVILDASKITLPQKGATILVNNKKAIVNDTFPDGVGAIFTIEFQIITELT